jgi:hypothetical protein
MNLYLKIIFSVLLGISFAGHSKDEKYQHFLHKWLIFPGKTIELNSGRELASKMDRVIVHRGQIISIGTITYGVFPNQYANNFKSEAFAQEYAELLRIPKFIKSRHVKKQNIEIYNSYWANTGKVVRLFVSTDKGYTRYAMAFYRKAYARDLNIETEIIGSYLMTRPLNHLQSKIQSFTWLDFSSEMINSIRELSIISKANAQLLPFPFPGGSGGNSGSGNEDYDAAMRALVVLGAVDWNTIVQASADVSAASQHFQKVDIDQFNKTMVAAEGAMNNISKIDTDQMNRTMQALQLAANKAQDVDVNQLNQTMASIDKAMQNISNINVEQFNATMSSVESAMNNLAQLDVGQLNNTFVSIENAMNTLSKVDVNQLNSTMTSIQNTFDKLSALDIDQLNTSVGNVNNLVMELNQKIASFDVENLNLTVSKAGDLADSAKTFIESIDKQKIDNILSNMEQASASVNQYLKDFNMDGINSIINNVNTLTGAIKPEDIQKIMGDVSGITSNVEGITGDVKTMSGTFAKMFATPEKAALTFASAIAIKTLTQGVVNLALDGIVKGMGALIRRLKGNDLSLEEKKKLFMAAMAKYDSHIEKIGKLEQELDKMISFFETNELSFEQMLQISQAHKRNTKLSQDVISQLKVKLQEQLVNSTDEKLKQYYTCAIESLDPIEGEIQQKLVLAENIETALQFDGLQFRGMKGKDALCGYFNHVLDSIFFLEYQLAELRDVMIDFAPEYQQAIIKESEKKGNHGKQLDQLVESFIDSEKNALKNNALYVMDNVKSFKSDCGKIRGCNSVEEEAVRILDGKLLLHRDNPFLTKEAYEEGYYKFLGINLKYKNIKKKDTQERAEKEILKLEENAAKSVHEIEDQFAKLAEKISTRSDMNSQQKLELLNRLSSLKSVYIYNVEQQAIERINTIRGIIHYANYQQELKNKPKKSDYVASRNQIRERAGLKNEELTKLEREEAKLYQQKLRAENEFINDDWRKDHKRRMKNNEVMAPPIVNAHLSRVKTFINDMNCGFQLPESHNAICDNVPFAESKRFNDLMHKQRVIENACRGKNQSYKGVIDQNRGENQRLMSLDQRRSELELQLDRAENDATLNELLNTSNN